MSASDNLSPHQFMPIEKIGAMMSWNNPTKTVDEWDQDYRAQGGGTAGTLDDSVAQHGVQKPLEVGNAWDVPYEDDMRVLGGGKAVGAEHVLLEGHHRYSAAKKAGHTEVPVKHIRYEESPNLV